MLEYHDKLPLVSKPKLRKTEFNHLTIIPTREIDPRQVDN